ncbi:hypothetical protein PspLS_02348 [Pyricularia sp. CBS 133598]|nr:hypothetical protein PspLS_02348 [Pyricularia sp. CBS 133598]
MASRAVKRRKITPPPGDGEVDGSKKASSTAFFNKHAASWNLEQDYENRPRKGKKKDKESTRLPIKTADGLIQHTQAPDADAVSDEDWIDDGSEAGAQSEDAPAEVIAAKVPAKPQVPEREQILWAKEELAKLAAALSEEPEENPGAFKALAQLGQTNIVPIKKLCLVTQMTIYKDVIPGYRIRPAEQDMEKEKLSKEVRRVRMYEQSLVSGYHSYIKELAALAKAKDPGTAKYASIAITCACSLLTSVPHFNFRTDLIKILVTKLSSRKVDDSYNKCLRALERLFRDDEEGRPAMEAVALLSKMMKARNYRVDESALNLFLHLRLLSEFSGKASQDHVDRPIDEGKKLKPKREFRTKRERKLLKEQKAVEKDMAHADALVSHEERDRMQSETLKLVFATYFRILKLRLPHLMGAVLEGLAKYAHLINQDFFGDLLEALKDLIQQTDEDANGDTAEGDAATEDGPDEVEARNTSRESLLCIVTAFALLAGQDAHNSRSQLHLDLSYFTTRLFKGLTDLSVNPDLELGAGSLHLPDPDRPSPTKSNKVNLQTTTVLLIRCLTGILLPPWNIRSVPPLRLAAFTKQLMTASLQVPEKSCQAILALLHDVSHTHGKKIAALWSTEERKGDGNFNPLSETVEGSNPFATTVWEGELLRRHYCPKVREGAKLLEKSLAM